MLYTVSLHCKHIPGFSTFPIARSDARTVYSLQAEFLGVLLHLNLCPIFDDRVHGLLAIVADSKDMKLGCVTDSGYCERWSSILQILEIPAPPLPTKTQVRRSIVIAN